MRNKEEIKVNQPHLPDFRLIESQDLKRLGIFFVSGWLGLVLSGAYENYQAIRFAFFAGACIRNFLVKVCKEL
jgi:hypothetical protein